MKKGPRLKKRILRSEREAPKGRGNMRKGKRAIQDQEMARKLVHHPLREDLTKMIL